MSKNQRESQENDKIWLLQTDFSHISKTKIKKKSILNIKIL